MGHSSPSNIPTYNFKQVPVSITYQSQGENQIQEKIVSAQSQRQAKENAGMKPLALSVQLKHPSSPRLRVQDLPVLTPTSPEERRVPCCEEISSRKSKTRWFREWGRLPDVLCTKGLFEVFLKFWSSGKSHSSHAPKCQQIIETEKLKTKS